MVTKILLLFFFFKELSKNKWMLLLLASVTQTGVNTLFGSLINI